MQTLVREQWLGTPQVTGTSHEAQAAWTQVREQVLGTLQVTGTSHEAQAQVQESRMARRTGGMGPHWKLLIIQTFVREEVTGTLQVSGISHKGTHHR